MRENIQTGIWVENQKLPSEEDLAKQLEVSRGTLRKAIVVMCPSSAVSEKTATVKTKIVQGRGNHMQILWGIIGILVILGIAYLASRNRKAMNIRTVLGALMMSMSAAANIFVGLTEASLVVKPYLEKMSRSELFAVMTGDAASVLGSVLVGYSLFGIPLEYLLAACFMAARLRIYSVRQSLVCFFN